MFKLDIKIISYNHVKTTYRIDKLIQLSNEFKLVCIQRLSQKLTELEFIKIRLLNGVIYNYIVICWESQYQAVN